MVRMCKASKKEDTENFIEQTFRCKKCKLLTNDQKKVCSPEKLKKQDHKEFVMKEKESSKKETKELKKKDIKAGSKKEKKSSKKETKELKKKNIKAGTKKEKKESKPKDVKKRGKKELLNKDLKIGELEKALNEAEKELKKVRKENKELKKSYKIEKKLKKTSKGDKKRKSGDSNRKADKELLDSVRKLGLRQRPFSNKKKINKGFRNSKLRKIIELDKRQVG